MTDDKTSTTTAPSFEERKKALIAQGALRRREVDKSIDIVRANLHVDKLARNAVNHLTSTAYNSVENMFGMKNLRARNLKKFLPLAATAYSIISRRNLGGPILRGVGIVGALSTGAFLWWRHRKNDKAARAREFHSTPYPDYVDPGR